MLRLKAIIAAKARSIVVRPDLRTCPNGGQAYLVNDRVQAPYPLPCSSLTGNAIQARPSIAVYSLSSHTSIA